MWPPPLVTVPSPVPSFTTVSVSETGALPIAASYIPRPWVATRRTSFAVPGWAIAMS